nr:olfactory receptor 7E24-like [Cavia porcellus]
MYLVTVLGNVLLILAVSSDSHLHTPMYFFLSSLSFNDICFTSTTVPKMIVDILTHSRVISYMGCLTQMSLFLIFATMDDMLLTVMAYDRFVAICHPLHYAVTVSAHRCALLLLLSVFLSLVESQMHNSIVLLSTCFKQSAVAVRGYRQEELLSHNPSQDGDILPSSSAAEAVQASPAGPKLRAHPEETEVKKEMKEIQKAWAAEIPQKANGCGTLSGNQKCGVKVG